VKSFYVIGHDIQPHDYLRKQPSLKYPMTSLPHKETFRKPNIRNNSL
jgi:hypothetical protein